MSLNLTPNELAGYRIKPDWYSFNVVAVKLHGPGSKNAGKEYEIPLAYCKSLEYAAEWLFGHAVRVQGELNQKDQLAADGSVADARALQAAYRVALAQVAQTVAEVRAKLDSLGLSQKELVQALGAPEES